MRLEDLLISPRKVDAVLAKFVTRNEDSGRHGVVIPVAAYSVFPAIPGFHEGEAVNHTVPIQTLWSRLGVWEQRASCFKHYHRYPERRITSLASSELDDGGPGTLIIIARRNDGPNLFEVHVLQPHDSRLASLLPNLGFESATPGAYVLEREWAPDRLSEQSPAVTELLKRFDALVALGKVTTLRTGPTGVGFTLEHYLGIAENNSTLADFDGVELKSLRSAEFRYDSPERTNLFLKEPVWTDNLHGVDRVEKYGYEDRNGRTALYSCVGSTQNSHGLRLKYACNEERLYIEYRGERIAYYTRDVLAQRLKEKLTQLLVVLADCTGRGANEQFRYHSVIHCAYPSIDELARLVGEGHVFIELRMHVPQSGTAHVRNHGTGFRIRMSKWPELFELVRALRGSGKK